MLYEVSAGAVLFRREGKKIKYLLLHYESGHWDFPKGHIEKGETKEETVLREVEEETGIKDIKIIPSFEERIEYFYKKENETLKKHVYFFLCETREKKVKLSFEHKNFVWLDYEQALKKITYPSSKKLLKKAHTFLSRKTLRDFFAKNYSKRHN